MSKQNNQEKEIELSREEIINEKILEVVEICNRINLQTDKCVFLDISGHVYTIKVTVCPKKKDYSSRVFEKEISYDLNWSTWEWMGEEEAKTKREENYQKIIKELNEISQSLNNIITKDYPERFEAYCSVGDELTGKQSFGDEGEAKRWVSKMKRKYSKYNTIAYYNKKVEGEVRRGIYG